MRILLLLFVTITTYANAQVRALDYFQSENSTVYSKYDTAVIYKGSDCWSHHWVNEKIKPSFFGCLVNHGAAGCPDRWLNQKSICTNCLRHIQVTETREVRVVKDPYEEALERLNKQVQNIHIGAQSEWPKSYYPIQIDTMNLLISSLRIDTTISRIYKATDSLLLLRK